MADVKAARGMVAAYILDGVSISHCIITGILIESIDPQGVDGYIYIYKLTSSKLVFAGM